MKRFERDPQSELVRRYARMLRSAPAEATRVASAPPATRAGTGAIVPPRSLRTPVSRDGARAKS